jgi:hypothetical protein
VWLVLCHLGDLPGLWAYRELKKAGLAPLQIVAAEALAYSLGWEHRLGTNETLIRIRLADGRVIRSDQVQGVLNRLVSVPLEHWQLGTPADRDYVAQEFTAFFVSWLYSLPCPVLNRSSPLGLSGAWRHASDWALLAQRVGLPVQPFRESSDDPPDDTGGGARLAPVGLPRKTVIAVAGTAAGADAPACIAEGCLRLAALAETPLLGVDFAIGAGGQWTFAGATPLPDLSLGDSVLIEALVRNLRRT